jgi:hypothetical protein
VPDHSGVLCSHIQVHCLPNPFSLQVVEDVTVQNLNMGSEGQGKKHVKVIVDNNIVELPSDPQSKNNSQTTGVHDVSKATDLIVVELSASVVFFNSPS